MNTSNTLAGAIAGLFLCLNISACGNASGNDEAIEDHASMPENPVLFEPASLSHPPQAREVRQLIIVGDSIMHFSITDGAATNYNTTAAILQQQDMHVTNLSLSAQTMRDAAASGISGAINFLTNHGDSNIGTAVWIELGVNDWGSAERTPEKFKADYTSVLNSIERGPNVTVYCVGMLQSRFDVQHEVNPNGTTVEMMRDVPRELGTLGMCEYVDTSEWFSVEEIFNGYTMPDGLHLGSTGHTKYSNLLLDTIK